MRKIHEWTNKEKTENEIRTTIIIRKTGEKEDGLPTTVNVW